MPRRGFWPRVAGVQASTIYRRFGDMRGLLDEMAGFGFSTHLGEKTARERVEDPVEDLRHPSPALKRLHGRRYWGIDRAHGGQIGRFGPGFGAAGGLTRVARPPLRGQRHRLAAKGRIVDPMSFGR